jgi:hypothetical protein
VGLVEKEKGRAALRKKRKRLHEVRTAGKSGGGLRELKRWKRFKRFLSERLVK